MLLPFLPVMLLSARAVLVASVAAPALTFRGTDPITGQPVVCDRCPPGTYLRARCTMTRKSECAPCPPGSFTELWNHIGKCLRCGVCGHDQVVKKACSADSDCQCQCKDGYYYQKNYDMCLRHRECPSGEGVLTEGKLLLPGQQVRVRRQRWSSDQAEAGSWLCTAVIQSGLCVLE